MCWYVVSGRQETQESTFLGNSNYETQEHKSTSNVFLDFSSKMKSPASHCFPLALSTLLWTATLSPAARFILLFNL